MCKNGYLSLFSCAYWKAAVSEFKSLKVLTFTALMIAASIVISSIFIPIGESLRVYFSFLANAICSMVGGPLVGLAAGFVVDIVGYVFHPIGAFFPGYTLSTMLGFLVFAFYLYRTRVTALKIILARLTISILVNVCLGSVWSMIIYGKAYLYYLAKSIVKNAIMFPIEVILLLLVFRAVLPILSKKGFIPKIQGKVIPII